jgi:hypothetical protein
VVGVVIFSILIAWLEGQQRISDRQSLKIEFYVPEEQLQQVKQAMFGAGARKVGDYDSCA